MEDNCRLRAWQQQQKFMSATLDDMRKRKFLTDLTLVCEGHELFAHRTQLCAASPFFLAMFESEYKESLTCRIDLPTVSLDAAEVILDFVYIGKLPETQIMGLQKLKNVLEASHLLMINTLSDCCFQLLEEKLCSNYFLDLWQLAELYDKTDVLTRIVSFLAHHFFEISVASDFFHVTKSQLLQILQHPDMKHCPADVILDGILTWIKTSQEDRKCELETLTQCLDFTQISTNFLQILAKDPLIQQNQDVCNRVPFQDCQTLDNSYCHPRLLCFGMKGEISVMTVYDVKTMSRSTEIILPIQLESRMSPAAANGNVYFIGGGTNSDFRIPNAAVYKYSPAANRVVRVTNLKVAIAAAGAVALNDHIYIVGGIMTGTENKTAQRLNIVNGTSDIICPTNCEYYTWPSVVTFQSYVYALGSAYGHVEKYDILSDHWTIITTFPGHPYCRLATLCDKKLLMVQVRVRMGSEVYLYDFDGDTWDIRTCSGRPDEIWGIWSTCHTSPILAVDGDDALHVYDMVKDVWYEVVGNISTWNRHLTVMI